MSDLTIECANHIPDSVGAQLSIYSRLDPVRKRVAGLLQIHEKPCYRGIALLEEGTHLTEDEGRRYGVAWEMYLPSGEVSYLYNGLGAQRELEYWQKLYPGIFTLPLLEDIQTMSTGLYNDLRIPTQKGKCIGFISSRRDCEPHFGKTCTFHTQDETKGRSREGITPVITYNPHNPYIDYPYTELKLSNHGSMLVFKYTGRTFPKNCFTDLDLYV